MRHDFVTYPYIIFVLLLLRVIPVIRLFKLISIPLLDVYSYSSTTYYIVYLSFIPPSLKSTNFGWFLQGLALTTTIHAVV